jgi:hypothetical protein
MRVTSGGDAAVVAVGKVSGEDTLQTFYDGFPGWGWGGWPGMGEATTTRIPQKVANLNVNIFDGSTQQLVWDANVLSSKPESNEHELDTSV